MNNLTIESLTATPVHEQAVEIVERKGRGHPDSICDAVMEAVSLALSREYIKRTGRVLHHNIDKGLLVAGEVDKHFGGGHVITPMELIIGDRATFVAGDIKIPVEDIARRAAFSWIKENLPSIDTERDITIRVALQPGSPELAGIFREPSCTALASNDTSAVVGLAPFTPAERAVFTLEQHINSPEFKAAYPETGTDVKVMGVRRGASLDLTVACPLFAHMIGNETEYFGRKEAIIKALNEFTEALPFKDVTLHYNCLDSPGLGEEGVYLSLLGTSAEDGDSGQVGRGNSIRGVIAMNRGATAEAAAGKNPVSHVGKIYAILAQKMADEIFASELSVKEARLYLVSRIGRPVAEPALVYAQVIPNTGFDQKAAFRKITSIVETRLSSIDTLMKELLQGKYPMC